MGNRVPEENRVLPDLAGSKATPAVLVLLGLVELQGPWAPGGRRESAEMWVQKVILVKSGFREFREIQVRSDRKAIRALSGQKVIQDLQGRPGRREIVGKKAIVALQGNRVLPGCRVSRENLAPRASRATVAVLALRGNKASPDRKAPLDRKEIPENKDRKGRRVTLALRGKKATRAIPANRVSRGQKVTPAILALRGKKATRVIPVNRVSKGLRARRVIPVRHQASQLLRIRLSLIN